MRMCIGSVASGVSDCCPRTYALLLLYPVGNMADEDDSVYWFLRLWCQRLTFGLSTALLLYGIFMLKFFGSPFEGDVTCRCDMLIIAYCNMDIGGILMHYTNKKLL